MKNTQPDPTSCRWDFLGSELEIARFLILDSEFTPPPGSSPRLKDFAKEVAEWREERNAYLHNGKPITGFCIKCNQPTTDKYALCDECQTRKCSHGNTLAHCDACDHLADQLHDAQREDRFFGRDR